RPQARSVKPRVSSSLAGLVPTWRRILASPCQVPARATILTGTVATAASGRATARASAWLRPAGIVRSGSEIPGGRPSKWMLTGPEKSPRLNSIGTGALRPAARRKVSGRVRRRSLADPVAAISGRDGGRAGPGIPDPADRDVGPASVLTSGGAGLGTGGRPWVLAARLPAPG